MPHHQVSRTTRQSFQSQTMKNIVMKRGRLNPMDMKLNIILLQNWQRRKKKEIIRSASLLNLLDDLLGLRDCRSTFFV